MKIKESTDIIAEILFRAGVKHVVVSSGSRSLRMVRAVADNKGLTIRMVVDERVAGFIALGIADATRQPVALICTSGTAMLNYSPAVAEAYYRRIPLIVITADRPIESIGLNDGQTIKQYHALENIVKASVDVDAIRRCSSRDFDNISSIISSALSPRRGPVHINLHLEERSDELTYQCEPYDILQKSPSMILKQELIAFSKLSDKKILFFIGQRYPDSEFAELIAKITLRENVVVVSDIIANCAVGNVVTDIESIINYVVSHPDVYKPDIVITLGKTSPISRRFKEWLRNIDGYKHWRINDQLTPEDTYYHLDRTIVSSDKAFLKSLIENMPESNETDYNRNWNTLYKRAIRAKALQLADAPWSDISAINMVIDKMPENYSVQCSNGMSIRYLSMIGVGDRPIYCNRGVNGIDGSTSTALGFANVAEEPTLLITGDMSAIYDVSALFSGQLTPKFKMIIMANKGGEIFRMIKATREYEQREQLLCNVPEIKWQYVANAVGAAFFEASDTEELESVVPKFFELNDRASILVINTPAGNSDIYKGIINKIGKQL